MQINLKKYGFIIAIVLLAGVTLYHQPQKPASKPVFFDRMPTNLKKARQHISISIDYEKLPARNEIRLVGRVQADDIQSSSVEYKWTLKNNLKHKKGSLSGTFNPKDTKEIFLDVAIQDMKKRIDVRLEAYAQENKVRIGGVQSFTYDPTQEEVVESAVQEKASTQILSKEEELKKQLDNARKPSFKQ